MAERKALTKIGVVVALIGVLAVAWGLDRRSCEREREQAAARHRAQLDDTRLQCDARAGRHAANEAQAVFQAFAAGVQGSALAGQQALLEQAKGAFLGLPRVAFVHVLAADGKILTTSDQKFAVDGRADQRASWALAAQELQTRPGDLPGTTEIAAPFQGAAGRVAVLWLGYKTDESVAAAEGTSLAAGPAG